MSLIGGLATRSNRRGMGPRRFRIVGRFRLTLKLRRAIIGGASLNKPAGKSLASACGGYCTSMHIMYRCYFVYASTPIGVRADFFQAFLLASHYHCHRFGGPPGISDPRGGLESEILRVSPDSEKSGVRGML